MSRTTIPALDSGSSQRPNAASPALQVPAGGSSAPTGLGRTLLLEIRNSHKPAFSSYKVALTLIDVPKTRLFNKININLAGTFLRVKKDNKVNRPLGVALSCLDFITVIPQGISALVPPALGWSFLTFHPPFAAPAPAFPPLAEIKAVRPYPPAGRACQSLGQGFSERGTWWPVETLSDWGSLILERIFDSRPNTHPSTYPTCVRECASFWSRSPQTPLISSISHSQFEIFLLI